MKITQANAEIEHETIDLPSRFNSPPRMTHLLIFYHSLRLQIFKALTKIRLVFQISTISSFQMFTFKR